MSYKTGFKNGRLGIGIPSGGGDGNGDPLYPLDINGDIRLTGAIVKADGSIYSSGGGVGVKGLYSVQDSNTGKYKFGVGKSNPLYTLDISGSLNLDGDIYVNGVSLSSGESTTASQASQVGDAPSWSSSVTTDLTADILAPLDEEFNTLLEIANAVQDICDNNLVINLATKANKASPTFTGTVTIPDLNIGGGKLIRVADGTDYGGIKVGYGENGKNYPVELSSGKAYVNVPWTDNNTTYSVGNGGLTEYNFTNALLTKLNGIATSANNYSLPATRSFTSLTNGNLTITSSAFTVSSGDAYFNQAGGGATYIGNTNNDTKINTSKVCIKGTTGNVGIGTASPEHKLQVAEVGSGDGTNLSDAIASIVSNSEPEYGKYGMYFGTHQTNGWSWIQTGRSGSASQSSATMGPQYNLCLQPNAGNVGIGTTTPESALHVKGTLKWDSPTLGVHMGIHNNTYAGIELVSTHDHGGWIDFLKEGDNDYKGRIRYKTDTQRFDFHPNGDSDPTMTIINGNVGIGTTSPRYKLSLGTSEGAIAIYENSANYFYGFQAVNDNGWGLCFFASTGDNTPSNIRMCIKRDTGNVGIGTTSVGIQTKLQVYEAGTEQAWKGRGVFGNETCAFVCGVYHNKVHIGGHNAALNAWDDLIIGGGNVGIGITPISYIKLHVNQTGQGHGIFSTGSSTQTNYAFSARNSAGNDSWAIRYDGTTAISSDDRLKHNEKPITNAINIIKELQPVKYFKTAKMFDENHNFEIDSSGNPITTEDYHIESGLIAQDVKTIPELQYCVGDGITDISGNKQPYNLNYQDIFVYNIAATQELYKENQELKTEVATLKAELAAIKAHLGI